MEAEQQTQEIHSQEENVPVVGQEQRPVLEVEQPYNTEQVPLEQEKEQPKQSPSNSNKEDRARFIHGLAVGLGIGCIATFVVVWITVFFTPLIPPGATYENLLALFIFPLIYLLAVGLIALTAGIVREYYAVRAKP